jgi:hypothetical protein
MDRGRLPGLSQSAGRIAGLFAEISDFRGARFCAIVARRVFRRTAAMEET